MGKRKKKKNRFIIKGQDPSLPCLHDRNLSSTLIRMYHVRIETPQARDGDDNKLSDEQSGTFFFGTFRPIKTDSHTHRIHKTQTQYLLVGSLNSQPTDQSELCAIEAPPANLAYLSLHRVAIWHFRFTFFGTNHHHTHF
ncbi:hypothetical protein KFK09_015612 [Dendrobium nobile]|uniref:Uncharacterized protein n=1 Tax=Dendrobium nobile TaxID=94219 RepID=A0A8T3B598_DENNO|nr:hypothetical protein KFK09_015612 [Dendrobium nobile]